MARAVIVNYLTDEKRVDSRGRRNPSRVFRTRRFKVVDDALATIREELIAAGDEPPFVEADIYSVKGGKADRLLIEVYPESESPPRVVQHMEALMTYYRGADDSKQVSRNSRFSKEIDDLAEELARFAYDMDTYEFNDQYDSFEEGVAEIHRTLMTDPGSLEQSLEDWQEDLEEKDMIDEAKEARDLQKRVRRLLVSGNRKPAKIRTTKTKPVKNTTTDKNGMNIWTYRRNMGRK